MSSSFVAALRAEVASLEEELSKSLVYQRLAEARKMLALYEPPAVEADETVPQRVLGSVASALAKPPEARPPRAQSPERAKALEAARLLLTNRSGPTPTGIIYDHVTSLGIEIGGKDPRNNLSAMLSNSPMFKSNGRSGWSLATDNGPRDPVPTENMAEPSADGSDVLNGDAPEAS
jgi:hypothetical protein